MIIIPEKFKEKLQLCLELNSVIDSTIYEFGIWFNDNKLEFFPEYTDHGINHINEVLQSSESIISDESWEYITSEDIFVLILSIIVHDCAMHLNSNNFIHLIKNKSYLKNESKFIRNEIEWSILWDEFFAEALRWDGKKLNSIFGSNEPIEKFDINTIDSLAFDTKHKLLIGEFIRRHHTRLAHEIILNGVPTDNIETIVVNCENKKLLDIAGLIARSHGYELREIVDLLSKTQRKQYLNCHIPFIMGILRVSDYIQIHSSRAPKQLIKIKKLVSPLSKEETKKHIAIDNIHLEHDDPEALFVETEPNDVKTFLLLKSLFKNIQYEMDSFWANIGEIYGRHKRLNNFGIVLRRIRSSIDYKSEFINHYQPSYVPESLSFKAADTEMLNLLVNPLYGNKPEVGIRELLQNALDACREKYNFLLKHHPDKAENYKNNAEVRINLIEESGRYFIIIEDNGIGMNSNVIKNYFFNIGASFRNSDTWKKENINDNGDSEVLRTGRFGIGVLAAFLLGEKIEVTTKYINDESGYSFSAKIDDEFIEMTYLNMEEGTKISIELNSNTYSGLQDFSKWDWFCLNWPKVTRYENNIKLEQDIVSFSDTNNLPENFYSVNSNEFESVVWSYFLERKNYNRYYKRDKYFSGLICNGIKIQDSFDYEFKINIAFSPSIAVDVPALIISDQNGRLPINLQRDHLTTYELVFLNALKDSISKFYVKDLVSKLSSIDYDIEDNIFLENKKIFFKEYKNSYAEFSKYPQVIIFRNEYLPFDYSLINIKKPKSIIFEPSENGCRVSNLLFNEGYDCVIPIENPDSTIYSRVQDIRSLFYEKSLKFNLESRALIIKKSEIDELSTKSVFPKWILKNAKEEKINDKWSIYKHFGFEDVDLDLNKIVSIMEEDYKYHIAIWNINWNDFEIDLSSFAKIWLEEVKEATLIPKKLEREKNDKK